LNSKRAAWPAHSTGGAATGDADGPVFAYPIASTNRKGGEEYEADALLVFVTPPAPEPRPAKGTSAPRRKEGDA
jgi:hypothetical protein